MKNHQYLSVLTSILTVSAVVLSGNVQAEEPSGDKAEKSPWTSSVELGYINTTGNTENQTVAGKADAVYEVDRWRHTGHAEGYGQKSEDATGQALVSAERYEASGKTDYKFNEHDYAFVLLKLQKDRFSGFEYEHILSFGYGRKALKKDNMELDLEIGPGQRFFKVDGASADQEALLRLAGKYWWAVSDSSKFTQDLSVDIGESITSSQSITGISANINETLALKFTYTIRHKTKVPAATEKLDTETALTLVYTF